MLLDNHASTRGVQEVAAGCLLIGARWRSALSPVGTSWSTRPRETELAVEPQGSILGLSLWHTRKTGVAQDYDFGIAGISEMKVVTSGELHIEHEGRKYIAYAGDTMMFLTDPLDQGEDSEPRPFLVRFFSDHECTTVWTDFAVSESADAGQGFV